ncbi:MAG TPA: phosphatase PAP2 family protein [Bacteroidota bacterium]|jgi:hypothetical protein|nr:phosphatase PAP2 family protein [Bacteroidota bacterium]
MRLILCIIVDKKRCIMVSLVVISLFRGASTASCISSSDSPGQRSGSVIADDASIVWKDLGMVFTAPLHFDECAWLRAGVVGGGTLLLLPVDHSARTLAQRNQSGLNDDLGEVGRVYGSGLFAFGLSGGVYLGGLAGGNEDLRTTGRMMFESVAFTGVTVVVLKSVTGRSRPYTDEGNLRFRPFQYQDDYVSLPSGHSALSFALSTVLSRRIHNTYVSLALYSVSTLSAISRVYEDGHWLSDTFLGAAIGTAIGLSVTGLHDDEGRHASVKIVPGANGISVIYLF